MKIINVRKIYTSKYLIEFRRQNRNIHNIYLTNVLGGKIPKEKNKYLNSLVNQIKLINMNKAN